MAPAGHLKLFPFSQPLRRHQRSPSVYLRSFNVCADCATRQGWWQQQQQHTNIRRFATMSTARIAKRTTGSAMNILGSPVLFSSVTQTASSRRVVCRQGGITGYAGSRKFIALGNASPTLSVSLWQSLSFSTYSSIVCLREETSHRLSRSQSRSFSSKQASKRTSARSPIPTTPPNAANIINTDDAATSSAAPTASSASQLQKLLNALTQLRKSGAPSIHVDTDRLNLAIKGVEDSLREAGGTIIASAGPVVRMAVLGLGNQQLTRRLVRLLLADPLGMEEEWEKQLDSAENDDGRAILLRYGERSNISLDNRLLYTFNIPSLFLQKNNLEILINTIDYASANLQATGETAAKAVLNPMLLAPSSAAERQTAITFPVHTTLIVGEGLESCIQFGRLSAGQRQTSPLVKRIKFVMLGTNNAVADAISVASQPASSAASRSPSHQETDNELNVETEYAQVDLERATEALSLFRKSAANSGIYEQGWHRAHMPQLMDWIRSQCAGSTKNNTGKESLKPAIRTLVSSVLADAHVSIGRAQGRLQKSEDEMLISSETKQSLNKALDEWVEFAYKELRDKLNKAFASHAWQDLSWWKLIWKADDVGRVAMDILTHEWLVNAEQEIIYLCGRMEEAGYHFQESEEDGQEDGNVHSDRANNNVQERHIAVYQRPSSTRSQRMSYGAQEHSHPNHVQPDITDARYSEAMRQRSSLTSGARSPPPLEDGPWPSPIPMARFDLASKMVYPLHRRAHMLFVNYMITFSGSVALGGLLSGVSYVGLYEAGSVALVSAVFGIRHFQKRWTAERLNWEEMVREEGRKAVRETETMVREILGEQKKKWISELERDEADKSNVIHKNFEANLFAEAAGPVEKALRALENIH